MTEQYTGEYYDAFKESSRASAEVVVPILMSWVNPRSVIDLGCGPGMWLSVWRQAGCDVRGVDGDWVDRSRLAIPPDNFVVHDLSAPYVPDKRYDLAMSLEAAEHLPPEAAAAFVRALTDAAPVVLFAAAIPNQSGTNHINCQWPEYWARLFDERRYAVIDTLRYMIWEDDRVDYWYRQNIMVYVARNEMGRWPMLEAMYREGEQPMRLVHPEHLNAWVEWGKKLRRRYDSLCESFEQHRSDAGATSTKR